MTRILSTVTTLLFIACLALTGCATTSADAPLIAFAPPASSQVPVPVPTAAVQSPIKVLAAGIGQLADHPLFKLVIKDAQDTQAWVNGPDGPQDALNKFRASQCPTAILLAAQDFQDKAKGMQATLLQVDAQLSGIGASMAGSGPEVILFLTRLRYGKGPAVDPKAQVQQIKDDVTNRVTAVVDSCRAIVPIKQIDEVLKIAGKAGLVVGTSGAAVPFLGLLP